MDPPPPGFVRVIVACVSCGHREVLDLQRRVIERRYPGIPFTDLPWRCVACGGRAIGLEMNTGGQCCAPARLAC